AMENSIDVPYVDLTIQFIRASGLPKMNVVGEANPYFVAKLEDRISFTSSFKVNTTTPVWNEFWRVKNVPSTANLHVEVLDRGLGATHGTPEDDYIGKFKCTVASGAKELVMEKSLVAENNGGTFWLKIESQPSKDRQHPFLFDGPIRYSRHCSLTRGLCTNTEGKNERLYSTWKMHIVGVRVHFQDYYVPWDRNYENARRYFQGPDSIAVRSPIQASHHRLYARSTYSGFGLIEKREGFMDLLRTEANPFAKRIKPAVYTYIISATDESFRFAEAGAAFRSTHALHASCAETVRYAGEFHPRPKGGWDAFSDTVSDEEVKWELVFDNHSGTYAPNKSHLPNLKALLEQNFPGSKIVVFNYGDSELTQSREACRAYALRCRGVKSEELRLPKEMRIHPTLEGEKEM
ncbi:hypothetical protein L218DRAFT_1050582, partial [Marasmius fiardii PR-910]